MNSSLNSKSEFDNSNYVNHSQKQEEEDEVFSFTRSLSWEKEQNALPGEEENKEFNQAKEEAIGEKPVADSPEILQLLDDPFIKKYISLMKGAGTALSPELLVSLGLPEATDVKIHTDAVAEFFCELMHAEAFAIGNDIFFRPGAFDPNSVSGKALLVHELVHTQHQKQRSSHIVQRQKAADNSGYTVGDMFTMITEFHKARKSGNEQKTDSAFAAVLSYFGLRKKLNLDDFAFPGFWDALKINAVTVNFSSGQPQDIAAQEGVKPNGLDVEADFKKGNVRIASPLLAIASMDYKDEGFATHTGAINLFDLAFLVNWPGERKGQEMVKGNIELKLKEGFIHDLVIENEGDTYKVGKIVLKDFSLRVNDMVLGQAKELKNVSKFIGFSMEMLTDLNKALMYSVKELISAFMGKKESSESKAMGDLMKVLVRQHFGNADLLLNIAKGIEVSKVELWMKDGNKEKPDYKLEKLESDTFKVSLLAGDKTDDSPELVKRKATLRAQQRKLEELQSKKQTESRKERIEKLNNHIENNTTEIFKQDKNKTHMLGIDATNVKLQCADTFYQAMIPSQAGDIKETESATATLSSIAVRSSFTGEKIDNASIYIPDVVIPFFTIKEIKNKNFDIKAKAIQIIDGRASMKLKYTAENGFSLDRLTFDSKKIFINNPVIKIGEKEIKVLENSPEVRLEGLSMEINNGEMEHLCFESAAAAEAYIPGVISATPVLKAGAFDFDKIRDNTYSYRLNDLEILSTYADKEGNKVTGEVKKAMISGLYDKDSNIVTTQVSIPSLKAGAINFTSQDGLSYLKMPAGNAEMTNLKADLYLKLQPDNDPKKVFYKELEIRMLHADQLTSNGLEAKIQSSKEDKPIKISFPSDKQAKLTNLNVHTIKFTEEGLTKITRATTGSMYVPELQASIENKLRIGGTISTGAIEYNLVTETYEKNKETKTGFGHSLKVDKKGVKIEDATIQTADKKNKVKGDVTTGAINYTQHADGSLHFKAANPKLQNAAADINKGDLTTKGNASARSIDYNVTNKGATEVNVDTPKVNVEEGKSGTQQTQFAGAFDAKSVLYKSNKDGSYEVTADTPHATNITADHQKYESSDLFVSNDIIQASRITHKRDKDGKLTAEIVNPYFNKFKLVLKDKIIDVNGQLKGTLKARKDQYEGNAAWIVEADNVIELTNINVDLSQEVTEKTEEEKKAELLQQKLGGDEDQNQQRSFAMFDSVKGKVSVSIAGIEASPINIEDGFIETDALKKSLAVLIRDVVNKKLTWGPNAMEFFDWIEDYVGIAQWKNWTSLWTNQLFNGLDANFRDAEASKNFLATWMYNMINNSVFYNADGHTLFEAFPLIKSQVIAEGGLDGGEQQDKYGKRIQEIRTNVNLSDKRKDDLLQQHEHITRVQRSHGYGDKESQQKIKLANILEYQSNKKTDKKNEETVPGFDPEKIKTLEDLFAALRRMTSEMELPEGLSKTIPDADNIKHALQQWLGERLSDWLVKELRYNVRLENIDLGQIPNINFNNSGNINIELSKLSEENNTSINVSKIPGFSYKINQTNGGKIIIENGGISITGMSFIKSVYQGQNLANDKMLIEKLKFIFIKGKKE